MNYCENRESCKDTLTVGFMGVSAFVGLIPFVYVLVWLLKQAF